MDPLSGFSLAVNIIQLLDFATKVVTSGYDISKGKGELADQNRDATKFAADIERYLKRLNESQADWIGQHAGADLDENEIALQELAVGCNEAAKELMRRLKRLEPKGRFRGIAAIRSGFLLVWKKDEIERYKSQLREYRQAMNTQALAGIRMQLLSVDRVHDARFTGLDKDMKSLAKIILDHDDVFSDKLDVHTDLLEDIRTGQARTHSLLVALTKERSTSPSPLYHSTEQTIVYPLHDAAKSGDVPTVRKLIASPAIDINAVDVEGRTALYYPCNTRVAERLIDGGAKVNIDDYHGMTPLHLAVIERKLDIVRLLLVKHANPKLVDELNKSPSDYAMDCPVAAFMLIHGPDAEATESTLGNTGLFQMAWLGDLEGVQFYLRQKVSQQAVSRLLKERNMTTLHHSLEALTLRQANVDARNNRVQTGLAEACRHGDLEIVRLLLDHGADIEATQEVIRMRPLIVASLAGRQEIVRELLRRGADIEAATRAGHKSIAHASYFGHWDVLKILVEHGADLAARDVGGCTSIHRAVHSARQDLVEFLVTKGAPLDLQENEGKTALLVAVQKQFPEIAEILIRAGANTSLAGNDGNRPLNVACQQGMTGTVRLLLDAGTSFHAADSSLSGAYTWTPLAEAAHHAHTSIVRMLLERGADPDIRTDERHTALHQAVRNDYSPPEIVALLLKAKANIEAKDLRGMTPLALACRWSNSKVVKVLLDAGADTESLSFDEDRPLDPGYTPVMQTVVRGCGTAETIALLAQHGANLNAQTTARQQTALLLALRNKKVDLVHALLDAGADVNLPNDRRVGPLHEAARLGLVDEVKRMLALGADLGRRDDRMVTPWILAKHSGTDHLFWDILGPGQSCPFGRLSSGRALV